MSPNTPKRERRSHSLRTPCCYGCGAACRLAGISSLPSFVSIIRETSISDPLSQLIAASRGKKNRLVMRPRRFTAHRTRKSPPFRPTMIRSTIMYLPNGSVPAGWASTGSQEQRVSTCCHSCRMVRFEPWTKSRQPSSRRALRNRSARSSAVNRSAAASERAWSMITSQKYGPLFGVLPAASFVEPGKHRHVA